MGHFIEDKTEHKTDYVTCILMLTNILSMRSVSKEANRGHGYAVPRIMQISAYLNVKCVRIDKNGLMFLDHQII